MKCREKPRIYDYYQYHGDLEDVPRVVIDRFVPGWSMDHDTLYVRENREEECQLCKVGDYILYNLHTNMVLVCSQSLFNHLYEDITE